MSTPPRGSTSSSPHRHGSSPKQRSKRSLLGGRKRGTPPRSLLKSTSQSQANGAANGAAASPRPLKRVRRLSSSSSSTSSLSPGKSPGKGSSSDARKSAKNPRLFHGIRAFLVPLGADLGKIRRQLFEGHLKRLGTIHCYLTALLHCTDLTRCLVAGGSVVSSITDRPNVVVCVVKLQPITLWWHKHTHTHTRVCTGQVVSNTVSAQRLCRLCKLKSLPTVRRPALLEA